VENVYIILQEIYLGKRCTNFQQNSSSYIGYYKKYSGLLFYGHNVYLHYLHHRYG